MYRMLNTTPNVMCECSVCMCQCRPYRIQLLVLLLCTHSHKAKRPFRIHRAEIEIYQFVLRLEEIKANTKLAPIAYCVLQCNDENCTHNWCLMQHTLPHTVTMYITPFKVSNFIFDWLRSKYLRILLRLNQNQCQHIVIST